MVLLQSNGGGRQAIWQIPGRNSNRCGCNRPAPNRVTCYFSAFRGPGLAGLRVDLNQADHHAWVMFQSNSQSSFAAEALNLIRQGALVCVCAPGIVTLAAAAPSAWPDFRGPRGDGHVNDAQPAGLPLHWNETNNVKWKTA